MLRIPPQLMGVVPQSAGGGSIRDASEMWVINELEPEQAKLKRINDWLGEEIVRFAGMESG